MMTNSSSKAIEAIEIKGRSLTVMVLHIKENDPRILYPQLEEKIEEAGALLGSSPVIIDVSAMVEEEQGALDFSYLKRALQGADLMPIGVQGAAGSQSSRIIQAGLPLMATNSKGPAPRKVTEQKKEPYTKPPQPEYDPEKDQPAASNVHPPPDTPPLPQTYSTAKVITQTVRSGQQIVAPEGDLIVLASVNAGSEPFQIRRMNETLRAIFRQNIQRLRRYPEFRQSLPPVHGHGLASLNPAAAQIQHQPFRAHCGNKILQPVHPQRSLRIKQAGSNNHMAGPGGNPFLRVFRRHAAAHLKASRPCRQGLPRHMVVPWAQLDHMPSAQTVPAVQIRIPCRAAVGDEIGAQ